MPSHKQGQHATRTRRMPYRAVVDVVETLGAKVQLNVTAGGHSLIARVNAHTQTIRHEDVELAINMDKIHFFEKTPPGIRIATEKR